MAIRILLDHGVSQDKIVFITLVVARGGGMSVLRRAFPGVRFVCAAVDDRMQEGWVQDGEGISGEGRKCWKMQPGMGHIGTRVYPLVGCLADMCGLLAGDRYYL